MIPFENVQGQPAIRDFKREKNARVLVDLLEVNRHYRFVVHTGPWNWRTVTQLYAKRLQLQWDILYIKGAPKKMPTAAEMKTHRWDDRSWAIPDNGVARVQVFSNKKLLWEGRL